MLKLRLAVVPGLVVAAAATVTWSGAAAARQSKARGVAVMCLNEDGSRYIRRVKPHDCAVFGPGQTFGGGVNLKKLHWHHWGQARARATGVECSFHLPCQSIPAKVRVSRLRLTRKCDQRAYTRLNATTRFGTSHPHPPGCPRAAF
jgi:hypothetical protein